MAPEGTRIAGDAKVEINEEFFSKQQEHAKDVTLPNGIRVLTGVVAKGDTGVPFNPPFKEIPVVTMAITGFDIDHGANARLGCGTLQVGRDGFTARVGTWADTGLYNAWAVWTAIGM